MIFAEQFWYSNLTIIDTFRTPYLWGLGNTRTHGIVDYYRFFLSRIE